MSGGIVAAPAPVPFAAAPARSRLPGRGSVVLALAVVVLAVAAPAWAWSHLYISNATFYAGDESVSFWNSNLNSNIGSFDNRYGGSPQLGVTYERTDGSRYSFIWSNTGFVGDSRTIAYGRGVCKANTGNGYPLFVYGCTVYN
jgi:hypothetical protein